LALKNHGSSVDPAESLGGNGRAFGSDGGTDGHEEAKRVSAHAAKSQSLRIPKSSCRSHHVLSQCPQHTIRARAEAHDVGEA
jgi:hypothetical protein